MDTIWRIRLNNPCPAMMKAVDTITVELTTTTTTTIVTLFVHPCLFATPFYLTLTAKYVFI